MASVAARRADEISRRVARKANSVHQWERRLGEPSAAEGNGKKIGKPWRQEEPKTVSSRRDGIDSSAQTDGGGSGEKGRKRKSAGGMALVALPDGVDGKKTESGKRCEKSARRVASCFIIAEGRAWIVSRWGTNISYRLGEQWAVAEQQKEAAGGTVWRWYLRRLALITEVGGGAESLAQSRADAECFL
jgi:hypothetical protein